MDVFAITLVVTQIVVIIAATIVGNEKGRNGFLWGFFLGIIGLIVVAILPALNKPDRRPVSRSKWSGMGSKSSEQKCPHCNSQVDAVLDSCSTCGGDLPKGNDAAGLAGFKSFDEPLPKIQCVKCSTKFESNAETHSFKKIDCPRCKKKITSKNVVYI